MNELLEFAQNHTQGIVIASVAGYEIVVRRKKTTKDWSLLSLAKRIGDLWKNRKKGGNVH